MPAYSYLTIQSSAEGSYKEKGSKFLAFAYPVKSEEEIKSHIEKLKKKYFDARHHCFAWALGAEKDKFRAFDDGEPNHSAGDPILGQIRSRDLTNILVVVVRYFGGIKLGVGGLVAAYKAAAYDALQNAKVIEEDVMEIFRLIYSYDATPQIMKLVKEFDLKVVNQIFEEGGIMDVQVSLGVKKDFLKSVELLKSLNVALKLEQLKGDSSSLTKI